MSEKITHYCYIDSPLGLLMLAGDKKFLRLVNFPPGPQAGPQARRPMPHWKANANIFLEVRRELDAYFAGTLQTFSVPLKLGGSAFQKQIWAALIDVPYGETASYGDIAKVVGNPGGSRAVGGANNANPIPIIIPCHRIVGADKSLTGFGSGLKTKRFLLDLEAQHAHIEGRLI